MVFKDRWKGLMLVALMLGVYSILLWKLDWLRFPIDRDETHFWPTTLLFSHSLLPGLQTLRGYEELNTPLAFVIFGQVERLTGHGLILSRYFNLVFSAAILVLIACAHGAPNRNSIACAFGLSLFPYFLGVSTHLYTDTIAALFVVAGVALQLRGRSFTASLFWILAIATRQYMVAFPIAAAIYELVRVERSAADPRISRFLWMNPAVAAASLMAWFAIFHGFAPPAAIGAQWPPTTVLTYVCVDHSLYFLSCIGLYYCLPEMILDPAQTRHGVSSRWQTKVGLAAFLAIAFAAFPPVRNADLGTMGYLDLALRSTVSEAARMLLLYLFALWALVRFVVPRNTFAGWMLLANAIVMMKAHLAWDKYAMPLLCVLWLLNAWETGAGERAASGSGAATPALQTWTGDAGDVCRLKPTRMPS